MKKKRGVFGVMFMGRDLCLKRVDEGLCGFMMFLIQK